MSTIIGLVSTFRLPLHRAGRLGITSKNMPHKVQNKDNYTLPPKKKYYKKL